MHSLENMFTENQLFTVYALYRNVMCFAVGGYICQYSYPPTANTQHNISVQNICNKQFVFSKHVFSECIFGKHVMFPSKTVLLAKFNFKMLQANVVSASS